VLTRGRVQSVGGILPLLVAMMPHRVTGVPLPLWVPLGEERGAMLAETWVRGWPESYPITLDAVGVGTRWNRGDFRLSLHGVRAGEPRFRAGTVEAVIGTALRVETDDMVLAWVPAAAPSPAVARVCRGADLVVVEVGHVPWPHTTERWRMSVSEALVLGGDSSELWIVRDDGSFGPADEH